MADYRLFLLDERHAITAREEFRAPNDAEALVIAGVVADACSDKHASFELWSLSRHVFGPAPAVQAPSLSELSERHQQHVLDLMEALQRSHWAVAKSQRLLEKKNELRALLDGRSAAPELSTPD